MGPANQQRTDSLLAGLFIFTVTSIIMVSATLCRTCGPRYHDADKSYVYNHIALTYGKCFQTGKMSILGLKMG
jgi:hypothetical protein